MISLYMYTSVNKADKMADMNLIGGQCGFCCCVLIIVYSSFRQHYTVDLPMFFLNHIIDDPLVVATVFE